MFWHQKWKRSWSSIFCPWESEPWKLQRDEAFLCLEDLQTQVIGSQAPALLFLPRGLAGHAVRWLPA